MLVCGICKRLVDTLHLNWWTLEPRREIRYTLRFLVAVLISLDRTVCFCILSVLEKSIFVTSVKNQIFQKDPAFNLRPAFTTTQAHTSSTQHSSTTAQGQNFYPILTR